MPANFSLFVMLFIFVERLWPADAPATTSDFKVSVLVTIMSGNYYRESGRTAPVCSLFGSVQGSMLNILQLGLVLR